MDFTFSDDAEMVRATVHEFVRRDLLPLEPKFLFAKTAEERKEITRSAIEKLKETGLYSAGVPEEFGGGGLKAIESCIIAEELSTSIIPIEWGELTPILYECNENQKGEYLIPVVQGEKKYALAFREPTHFTTAAQMATTARLEGDVFLLNGVKLLSRPEFDFCLLFALAPEGPTCFILDRDIPGCEITVDENGFTQITLTDCALPREKILGNLGGALTLGQKWFPLARITRSAAILGVCRRILETTALYVRDWKSMGESISTRPEIQRTLAEMAGNIESLRWLVYYTAWLASSKEKINFESMLCKLQAQKILQETVNSSVRIHGGTMPPIQHWLINVAKEGETLDMLRLAVSREVITRYAP